MVTTLPLADSAGNCLLCGAGLLSGDGHNEGCPVGRLEQRIAELEAAVDRLSSEEFTALGDTEQEAERYREWLLEYGRHGYGCVGEYGEGYRCRCGWRDVEAELKGEAVT